MLQDLVKNELLKRMWAIDHKLSKGNTISSKEHKFYNDNLHITKGYYEDNAYYWLHKEPLKQLSI